MKVWGCFCVLAAMYPCTSLTAFAGTSRAEGGSWATYRFLIGNWVGEGSGKPGEGSGGFSLEPDLQGKVLIRRNVAEYPASAGRPAFKHEDLMVIYHGESGKPDRAVYFDSEGHTIQYVVAAGTSDHSLIFTSEAQPASPRYRFSYAETKADEVALKFEIAPPGSPDAFKTYLEGKVRRKSDSKARADAK